MSFYAAASNIPKNVRTFIDDTIIREGGDKFTNNPKDSGGPTRYGITEAVARAFGYRGKMEELPRSVAELIYVQRYWIEPGFGRIAEVFPRLGERLFDFGVLAGQKTSAEMLQRCLNVLNRNGRDYPDLVPDGRIGTMTVGALRAYVGKRGDDGRRVLVGMVASLQSVYLMQLAEQRPKDEEWQFGWQLNRAIGAVMGPV